MTSPPEPPELGPALRAAREAAGWTQEKMAEHAGVSRYTLQKSEYGKSVGRRSERLLRDALHKLAGTESPTDPMRTLTEQVAALQNTVKLITRGAA